MMKQLKLFLAVVLLLPSLAHSQALPDAPAPAPPPDPAWERVRGLAPGQPIVVIVDNAPPLHCLFAAATGSCLFCNPPGNPAGVGYRIDRANVVSVVLDLPPQNSAQFDRPRSNFHPQILVGLVIGGVVTGLLASQHTDSGRASLIGLLGAGVGAGIAGLPDLTMASPQSPPPPFESFDRTPSHIRPPRYGPRSHSPPRLSRIR